MVEVRDFNAFTAITTAGILERLDEKRRKEEILILEQQCVTDEQKRWMADVKTILKRKLNKNRLG